MRDDPRAARAAALQALVAVTVWGASFAATKRVLAELSPGSVLFTRTVLGTGLVAGGDAGAPGGARRRPHAGEHPHLGPLHDLRPGLRRAPRSAARDGASARHGRPRLRAVLRAGGGMARARRALRGRVALPRVPGARLLGPSVHALLRRRSSTWRRARSPRSSTSSR